MGLSGRQFADNSSLLVWFYMLLLASSINIENSHSVARQTYAVAHSFCFASTPILLVPLKTEIIFAD